MAVLKQAASETLSYFILAILMLRQAFYRFVQIRAGAAQAARARIAAETPGVDQTIFETTTSQICDVVVYRSRPRKSRVLPRSSARRAR